MLSESELGVLPLATRRDVRREERGVYQETEAGSVQEVERWG